MPSLTGQYAEYLVSTLESYRDGSRQNDENNVVSDILKRLTEQEAEEVAAYYQSLGNYTIEQ